jgi:hypothetical protein
MLPGRGTSRRARPLAVALLALACAACSSSASGGNANTDEPTFAPNSSFNTPIPPSPFIAANSAGIVRQLVASGPPVANLYAFGTPVYEANASTPRKIVRCTDPELPCELANELVPIPDNAKPSPGSDGAMDVVDRSAGTSYEFFRATRQADGSWIAASTSKVALGGDGRHGQTGSGISLLAGLIRVSDIGGGAINHAVEFASRFTCSKKFVYPAVKTDGVDTGSNCVAMGARLQLDPAVDVSRLPGLSRAERSIALALQRYGGFVRNTSGAALALGFENPSGESDPYPAAGLKYDYERLSGIPWDRLRVVNVP